MQTNQNPADRIDRIRNEERKYHEECYGNYRLFEAGSWLHKPVKTVMETLEHLETRDPLHVLDLGCGVGRNSIPMAETLRQRSGKVVCVDLIQAALDKLREYSEQYGVSQYIEPQLCDIGHYEIAADFFDYIIAVSALEHVESEPRLIQVLDRMVRGTKAGGINCIIMSTNIKEIDRATGAELEPLMEVNMSTGQAGKLLSKAYEGWEVLFTSVKPLQFHIERNGCSILLTCDSLTYTAHKA